MKIKLIVFFSCLSLSVFSQQKRFTGIVVDSKTKNPIEGVLLVVKNEIIAYTDGKGQFDFSSLNENETISFVHLSYKEKTAKIQNHNIKKELQITLVEQTNGLEEVVINGVKEKLNKKQIVKSALKQYKKQYRKEPYWSTINLKETKSKKFTLKEYTETDGVIWMQGENNDAFNSPIVIPLKARIANFKVGIDSISAPSHFSLLFYRFFEQVHPLSKRGYRHFEYGIEKTVYLNNEACYVINYKERSPISVLGWKLNFMRGQIWISKTTFTLKKLTSSFRFSTGADNIFTIDYVKEDKTVYPKKINYSYTFLKHPKAFRIKGELSFIKIDTIARENYRKIEKLYNQNYFNTSSIYKSYDQSYWSKKPFGTSRFESGFYKIVKGANLDSIFKKSSASKIFFIPKDMLKKRTKEEALILSIMKKDLKIK